MNASDAPGASGALAAAGDGGRLAGNVLHFARLLRGAGLPLGTDRVQLALEALAHAGLDSRADFRTVLAACLLDRVEHRELFDLAFELFWRVPDLDPARAALPPLVAPAAAAPHAAAASRRLADALAIARSTPIGRRAETDPEGGASASPVEALRRTDFDAMSADEWRAAQRLLARWPLVVEPLPTRRSRRAARAGRPDPRATLSAMARHGGELWDMRWRRPRTRPAPLVLLADISRSMSRYSRMLLHFAHAVGHAGAGVESFVFGTRLTRTTRLLMGRDPDLAVAQVVHAVPDWAGGTRIHDCLREFNRRWARRVLGGGRATVLLVSDGLEHGDAAPLAFEMERLHKSCRRLWWLNPLLRYERFEPRAAGMRAMRPHVDRLVPAHNLDSLAALVDALAAPSPAAR